MKTHKYSRFEITDPQNPGFSPQEYSRFKYGCGDVARKFGIQLAEGFIKNILMNADLTNERFVVAPSPYSFIPTATFAMKTHFVFRLNKWLAEQSLPVIQETKIHRTVTYKEDYGALSKEERLRLISNDIFEIDPIFTKGKTLILLDDIRITGSHERVILKMAQHYGLENKIHLLYFAELVNENVHPSFENELNYAFVKGLKDLEDIVTAPNFQINTRVVKFMLSQPPTLFAEFIADKNQSLLESIFNHAIGNEYHLMDAYVGNLEQLGINFSNRSPTTKRRISVSNS